MAMGDKKKSRKRKNSSDSFEGPTRTLKQYTIEEKLEIIDFAKSNGNRAAGREYNVAESSIREWRKNEEKLKSLSETDPERQRLNGGGRRVPSSTSSKSTEELEQVMKRMHAPLSLTVPLVTMDQNSSENHDQEASLGGESNGSTHSSSPTISVSGTSNGTTGGSSSRRKAKQPRKLISLE